MRRSADTGKSVLVVGRFFRIVGWSSVELRKLEELFPSLSFRLFQSYQSLLVLS